MNSELPLVGIVVPVYNGGDYLAECLRSILAQTYNNWQGVVVNNCSTDSTAQIAETFSRLDPRLRVLHCKEFVGQAENYNRAVAQVESRAIYVKIVEADNRLTPECLQRMIQIAQSDPKTGVVGCHYRQGAYVLGSGFPVEADIIDGNAACRMHLLQNLYFFGCPTSLLFRSEALRGMATPFRPGLFHDDVDLCFRVLRQWKFGFVHQVLAFVREDNGGLFSQFSEFGFRLAMLRVLMEEYGRIFLTDDEYLEHSASVDRQYRRQLGRALLGRHGPAYWDFHRQVFRLMGKTLDKKELVGPSIIAATDLLFNPKSTLERVWRRLERKRPHSASSAGSESSDERSRANCATS